MNYLFYFIMLFVFSLSTNNVYGQSVVSTKNTNNETKGSAVINKVWIEHNTTMNNKSGITIHTDLNVKGMKGKKIEVLSYFYDSGKNKMMGGVTGYKTQSGQVCHSYTTTPSYESSHWEDFKLFIPYSALPSLSNNQTYYVTIRVLDVSSSEFINDKVYTAFKGPNRGSNPSNLGNQPSLIGTWKTVVEIDKDGYKGTCFFTFKTGNKVDMKILMEAEDKKVGKMLLEYTIPGSFTRNGQKLTIHFNPKLGKAKIEKIVFTAELEKLFKDMPSMKNQMLKTLQEELDKEKKELFENGTPLEGEYTIKQLTATKLVLDDGDDIMTFTR